MASDSKEAEAPPAKHISIGMDLCRIFGLRFVTAISINVAVAQEDTATVTFQLSEAQKDAVTNVLQHYRLVPVPPDSPDKEPAADADSPSTS